MNNRPYNKYNRDYIVGICNGDGCLLTTAIYLSMPSSVKPTCFIAQEASKPLSAPAVPLSLCFSCVLRYIPSIYLLHLF